MSIQLVIDTCADLDPKKDINNTIALPIAVYIQDENGEDKEYIPFENLQPSEFYQKQKNAKKLPHTSQVAVGVAYQTFKDILQKGDQILGIFMGSGHSGTYNSCVLAKNQLVEELGSQVEENIKLIDSENVTFPLAALCLLARDLIDEGKMNLNQIYDYVSSKVNKIHMRAYIDDLTYLKMGGRISGVSAALGNLLNFKIVIKTGGNLITPTDKLRGLPKTYQCIVDTMIKEGYDSDLPLYIGHTNSPERAEILANLLKEKTGKSPRKIIEIGATVGAHVGPGATGLCWFIK